MSRILIPGARGQLGTELVQRAPSRGFEPIGLGREGIDVSDRESVFRAVKKYSPSLIMNATAYNLVDKAESEPNAAMAVNRDGPANLADACRELEIPLFHISSDYVFDGSKPTPYSEDDPVAPLGAYGRSKEAGESAVRQRLEKHIIVRTSWLFSATGNNFVKTMVRLARERDSLSVVGDQHGKPTFAGDLADALLHMAEAAGQGDNTPWGTYHFSGEGKTTWHGFALAIFKMADELGLALAPDVRSITTAEYNAPAPRPANSVLDCGKISSSFGISPRSWTDGLRHVLDQLAASG